MHQQRLSQWGKKIIFEWGSSPLQKNYSVEPNVSSHW